MPTIRPINPTIARDLPQDAAALGVAADVAVWRRGPALPLPTFVSTGFQTRQMTQVEFEQSSQSYRTLADQAILSTEA